MKNTRSETQPGGAESTENNQTAVGFDVVAEYETTGLLAAELPELVSATTQPGGVLRRWMPILLKFASVQVAVQFLGFIAGILVIRNLPKREYALYTLGNTMLGTILLLADSGISSALTAIGGRIWHDNHRLSQLIQTALELRRLLAIVSLPVVIPVLVWLLMQNGASVSRTTILVGAVLLGCGLELVTRIYAVALRLRSEIRQIQNQALVAAFVRFTIVGLAVLFWFNVEIAIFAVVAGFAAQYLMLRQWHTKNLEANASSDLDMRSEILGVVKKAAPHTVYYCLQAQITIWLISIFGNANNVADVGALGRLAVVFSILGSLTSEVLFPAFARIRSAQMLRRRYFQIVIAFTTISLLLIAGVALFPGQVLAVLGKQYSHLHTEGVLMAISSVLGAISGLTWGLNFSRAWIVSPLQVIPVTIVSQVVLVCFLNLSTVRGVIVFSIFSTVPSIAWAVWFALLQISKLQAAE